MGSTAFVDFFHDELGPLVAFLQKIGFGRAQAEDAAAEAMTCACEKWSTIQSPRAWVRTAAYRVAVGQVRRSRDGILRAVAGGWAASSYYDADAAEASEERHQILEMLDQLPRKQRLVMAWQLDGFDNTEISEQLAMSPTTVRSNLRHARKRLKAAYLAGSGAAEGTSVGGEGVAND